MSQNFPGSIAAGSTAARQGRGKRSARALSYRMGGHLKRGLLSLPTCQNKGYPRVFTPLTRRQSWLRPSYYRYGGSEVLFTFAARPLGELRNQNHTGIMDFRCPFGSEIHSGGGRRESNHRGRDAGCILAASKRGRSGWGGGNTTRPKRKTAHLREQMGGQVPLVLWGQSDPRLSVLPQHDFLMRSATCFAAEHVDLSSAAGRSAVSGAGDAAP
jgi:hypothetical protein